MKINYCSPLTIILDVVQIFLVQSFVLYIYNESFSSRNKRNFLKILNWYAKKIKRIESVINKNAPGNNQLTSLLVQDEKRFYDFIRTSTDLETNNNWIANTENRNERDG